MYHLKCTVYRVKFVPGFSITSPSPIVTVGHEFSLKFITWVLTKKKKLSKNMRYYRKFKYFVRRVT